ncbi:hypothetical protein MRX96_006472 [Rhipicephalus microplus]
MGFEPATHEIIMERKVAVAIHLSHVAPTKVRQLRDGAAVNSDLSEVFPQDISESTRTKKTTVLQVDVCGDRRRTRSNNRRRELASADDDSIQDGTLKPKTVRSKVKESQ